MSQLVKEVVAAVIAVREAKQRIFIGGATFYSVNDIWLYIEISDDKLCDVCHANAHMEGGEYKGNRIRGFFPYHEILDINTIKVNQHPHCRCIMVRKHPILETHENITLETHENITFW